MILKGRLPPEKMFPAGYDGFRQRYLDLASGRTRIVEYGEPTAPPVLLIHGWGVCAYQFRRNMPALAEAGFRAVALDLRGHGLSEKTKDENAYTTTAILGYVLSVIDALGATQIPVIGHSMGGTIAAHLAIKFPERVEKLVLIDAVGYAGQWLMDAGKLITPAFITPLIPYIIGRPFIRLLLWLVHGENKRYGPEEVEQYWAPSQFPEYGYAIRHLVHKFDWTGAGKEELLRRLDMPTLVIYGTKDAKAFRQSAEHYARTIPGAKLLRVEGAGHVANEEASELVNLELTQFLKLPGS